MYRSSDRENFYAESKFIHNAFHITGHKKSRRQLISSSSIARKTSVEENGAPPTIGHLHSAGSFAACNAEGIRDGTDGGEECRHFYVASRTFGQRERSCARATKRYS